MLRTMCVKLPSANYRNLLNWLIELSNEASASEGTLYKSIIDLMLLISERLNSPCLMIKYLIIDYHDQFLTEHTVSASQSLSNQTPSINENIQFGMLKEGNKREYKEFLINKATTILNDLAWLFDTNTNFNSLRLVELIYKQLKAIVIALEFVIGMETAKQSLDDSSKNLLSKFFELNKKYRECNQLQRASSSSFKTNNNQQQQQSSDESRMIDELFATITSRKFPSFFPTALFNHHHHQSGEKCGDSSSRSVFYSYN